MTPDPDIREAQLVLAHRKLYDADVDGIASPRLSAAIDAAAREAKADWSEWPAKRRRVAALQVALDQGGFQPGAIDGLVGHNTREALTDALTFIATGRRAVVARPPAVDPKAAQKRFPRQADMAKFYGPAGGTDCTAGQVILPIPFTVAWEPDRQIRRFACHILAERPFTAILGEAVKHYGETQFRHLRLHLYGGCYMFRAMRGGTALSTHAWGAALDLDPERNPLRWGRDKAAFAQPAYDAWWRIVEAHGATSLGRAANRDWMHIQLARL